MADLLVHDLELPYTPRTSCPAGRQQQQQFFPPPSVSPTGARAASGLRDEDEDHEEERKLTAQERLLRSPTDKLLSPVSRALKAHHKRSPKRVVRTSLASLLDVEL